MDKFYLIKKYLSEFFNIQHGLSEKFSVEIYVESVSDLDRRDQMRKELIEAFGDKEFVWKHWLFNDEYEVASFDSEAEARAHAKKILWDPVFGKEHIE